ncbi:MAG: AAA family ATPase [Ilumatobacteraceae bacterium]
MHPARLFIVCGLPGSDTAARSIELAERFAAIRMTPDAWINDLGIDIWTEPTRARIERIQCDLAAEALRAGTSVVVEWGTRTRSERDDLRSLARSVGAFAHLELLDASIDELQAYDPWPPVRAGDRPGSPAYPYGSWLPTP